MKDLKEMRSQRAQKLEDAQGIVDAAQASGRSLSDEERSQFDGLMKSAETLAGDIKRHESLAEQRRQAAGQTVTGAQLGLSDGEVRRFSILRLLDALANPADQRAQKSAAFEIEACQEAAKMQGRSARGVIVPQDMGMAPGVMARIEREGRSLLLPVEITTRDLLAGTPSAGGNLVATDLLSGSMIDMLTNAMSLNQLGVTRLSGLVGNAAIPRKTTGSAAYWVAENGAPTESQQAIDQVALTPRTVGAYTDFSRQLMKQSSIDVEAFVRRDLALSLALGIDLAGINGTGASGQPRGVLNTSGIGAVVGGTNGAAPTWANIVGLETEVAIDNADLGSLAYLVNAKTRGKLKTTEKASNTAKFLWDDGVTPLNGYKAAVSNQVPGALTKGTANGICSALLFGNWADLVMGLWGGLDLLVDPYTGSSAGTVRVVAFQSVDFAVRHPESFAAMTDALTS
jgi:HK97 family phage major capsid protein